MILQKSFQYADLLLKKHFWLLSVLKTVVLLHICVETNFVLRNSLMNSLLSSFKKKKTFINIIDVFTCNF